MPSVDPSWELDWLARQPPPKNTYQEDLDRVNEKADPVASEILKHRALGGVTLIPMGTVEPRMVEWLWPGRIPRGKLTIIDGHPGQGKSTLTMAIAACVSTGRPLPDSEKAEPANVLILSAEDGLDDTILPRLQAHRADVDRIVALDSVTQGNGDPDRHWTLPDDMEQLEYALRATQAKLVVIDPLMAFLSGATDSHRDQDIRRALHPLSRLAQQMDVAVVIVRHLTKGGDGLAMLRGQGSIGITGAARSVLLVGIDPNDETAHTRVLAVSKMNVGVPGASLAFHLDTDPELRASRVVWDGISYHTSETLLLQINPEELQEVARACDILKFTLGSRAMPVPDVLKATRLAGVEHKYLAKARRLLGVRDLPGEPLFWELPRQQGTT